MLRLEPERGNMSAQHPGLNLALAVCRTCALLLEEDSHGLISNWPRNTQAASLHYSLTQGACRPQLEKTHLDEGVQLLVTSNGKLQVTGGDTLHLSSSKASEVLEACTCSTPCAVGGHIQNLL